MFTLSLFRHDDPAERILDQRSYEGGELVIGRGGSADWVIADPTRVLSKRHCELRSTGRSVQLVDSSANGVYLNGSSQRMIPGQGAPVHIGDRIRIGEYVLRIDPPQVHRGLPERTMDNPFAPPAQQAGPMRGTSSVRLHNTESPLFGLGGGSDPFRAADTPVSALAHGAWKEPEKQEPLQPQRPRGISAAFDKPMLALSEADPDQWRIPEDWNDWDGRPAPSTPAPVPPPVTELVAPVEPALPPGASASAAAGLFEAFLEGAQLGPQDFTDCDKIAVMRAAGEVYRATILGLSDILHDRAFVKDQFRIAQTRMGERTANPLRMFEPAETAILLLKARMPTLLKSGAAITHACADVKKHQLALLAGLRGAIRATLEALDPSGFAPARKGLLARLSGDDGSAAFRALVERHKCFCAEADDNPDSLVSRELRRGYESYLEDARRADARAGRSAS